MTDAVVEARFFNPYPTSAGTWSYGFLVRSQAFNTFDAVFVRSNKVWYQYNRSGSVESGALLASGFVSDIDTEPGRSTHLLVIASGKEGWLFVNERFVTNLNLGGASARGDIVAIAGYFESDEIPGSYTRFEDFTVWSP